MNMMSASPRRAFARHLVAIAVGTLGCTTNALAQGAAPADIQRQVDDAFKEVVANAASLETRLKYARLLVQAGNYEGGIAALEGALLAPDAPAGIRLELAVLYYRLGSYAMAETYLREALADPRLDAALRSQADALLVDVGRRNAVSHLSGSVMLGLRAQSNPTAATSHGQVLAGGISVPRDERVRRNSDVDAFVWGKLDHSYDLGAQNEATVVTSVVGLANHYASVDSYALRPGSGDPYDLVVVAGTSGIRFKPSAGELPNLTVMPHLIFGGALLNGRQYFGVGGVGLEGNNRISERLQLGGVYEARHFSFKSRADIANASLQDGLEQTIRLRSVVETGIDQVLLAEVGYVDHEAERSHFEFRGPTLRVAYSFSHAGPLGTGDANWTTTLAGSAARRHYRGADPAVDPTRRRRDTEQRLSLINAIPLARNMALQVQIDYTRTPSNLPNYEYSNVAGSVGVMWKY